MYHGTGKIHGLSLNEPTNLFINRENSTEVVFNPFCPTSDLQEKDSFCQIENRYYHLLVFVKSWVPPSIVSDLKPLHLIQRLESSQSGPLTYNLFLETFQPSSDRSTSYLTTSVPYRGLGWSLLGRSSLSRRSSNLLVLKNHTFDDS